MRREIELTLKDRSKELVFIIREMSASKLEKWLVKALLLISKSQINNEELNNSQNLIEENDTQTADFSLFSKILSSKKYELLLNIDFEQAEELYDDLLTCVHRKVDNALISLTKDNVDSFIEDVQTLFRLRLEVIKLNLDFFTEENQSDTIFSTMKQETAQNYKEHKTYDMRISPLVKQF